MILRKALIVLATLALSSSLVSAAPIVIAPEQLHDLRGQRTQLDAKVKELNESNKQISVSQADNSSAKETIKLQEAASKKAKANLEKKQAYDRENPGEITEQLRAAEEENRRVTRALKDAEEKRADTESKFNRLNTSAVREYAEFKRLQKSYEGDVDRVVDHQLQERMHALQVSKVIEVSAQVSCGDESVATCKERSKKAAELKASEQGSVVLVNSLTEVKNFKLTKEELRSEVRATLSDEKILSQNFMGDSGFETKISVKVEPAISDSLRQQMAGAIRAEVYTMLGGRIDYAQVQNPSLLQELRADESISASKSAPADITVSGEVHPTSPNTPPQPSANNPQSKKVGDIVVTVRRIQVLNGQVAVALGIDNQSTNEFKLAVDANDRPALTDENGNQFEYLGGLNLVGGWIDTNAQTLNPKSNSDVVLNFKLKDSRTTLNNISSSFGVAIRLVIYNVKENHKSSNYKVSFFDIKAHSPKTLPPLIANNPPSKKVGDIVVTVRQIQVLKGKVAVALDIANQSDNEFKLAVDANDRPALTDENGNQFEYLGGLNLVGGWIDTNAQTLNPKSNSDVVLNFKPKDSRTKFNDIGSSFGVTIRLVIYDVKENHKSSNYKVSFFDIKAHSPNKPPRL